MPSPFDWALFTLNNKNNAWYFIIHDADGHPGDSWPRPKSISWRVNASKKIVALSEFVSKKIAVLDPGKTAVTIPHPHFQFVNDLQSWGSYLPPKYILFVGRIRDYKGLDILLDAMKKIDSVTLIIAGEGVVPTNELKNVFILNEWISENQISYLIHNALCVVFPYREASQSGLLPLAMSLNKRIVATDVGALSEQLGDYRLKHFATPADVESLVCSIQMALSQPNKSDANTVEKDFTAEETFTMERFFQELFKNTLY
jgi:glycosyltransferase involved in cell wall biosynthesis